MKTFLLTSFQRLFNDDKLTHIELLQPLWSGYGEIARFDHPKLSTSVIIKSVKPPQEVNHPRGWHSDVGHVRKLISYQVEAAFYQHFAQHCDQHCYVPRFIAYDITFEPKVRQMSKEAYGDKKEDSLSHKETDYAMNSMQGKAGFEASQHLYQSQTLVMEDLQASGFNDASELGLDDINVVIRWLAYFHARFMGESSAKLWPIGTYWHLSTRQDEYNAMESGALKASAEAIDSALNNAHYQTLVHGDAKLANFCFGIFNSRDFRERDLKRKSDGDIKKHDVDSSPLLAPKLEKRVAAVDFQYVGRGVGVKDLAYFLGSCLGDDDLNALHVSLSDNYFMHLQEALVYYRKDIDFSALEKEWRGLYALSCADFHRFLQGWSPEHQKINTYLQSQTNIALEALK